MMPALNVAWDMVDDASGRQLQGFLEALPEAHPLWGVRVLINVVIKALYTQQ